MKERHRIGKISALVLYFTAIIFDLLGMIPIIDWIISAIGYVLIFIMFLFLRVHFIKKPKKIIYWIGTIVFSYIPILGLIPAEQFINVFLNIRDTRKEDKKYNNEQRRLMEEQIDEENRIRQAMWLRERSARGNQYAEDQANDYLDTPKPKRQNIAFNFREQPMQEGRQQPSRTGGLVRRGVVKTISVIQPEIGAAIAVSNRVKQVENIVGRKITPRPGYNRRA
ncbi:MAG: hypothetical protein M3Q73_01120 [bacterium]|nr:hypothetical protein [bacterium]